MVLEHPSAAFPAAQARKKYIEPLEEPQPTTALPSANARKKFIDLLEKAQPSTTIALVEYEELKREHWLLKWVAQAGGRAGNHCRRPDDARAGRQQILHQPEAHHARRPGHEHAPVMPKLI